MKEKSIATLIQEEIVALLNADAPLMQGSCKALAENSMDILSEINQVVSRLNGVAVVVTTPAFEPDGEGSQEATVAIRSIELPALRVSRPAGAMTALDAALRVRSILPNDKYSWISGPRQESDIRTGTLSATTVFALTCAY